MPEDFSKVFTVEIKTGKGWEVVDSSNNMSDAIQKFIKELGGYPIYPVRLTSPTDLSIYGE